MTQIISDLQEEIEIKDLELEETNAQLAATLE